MQKLNLDTRYRLFFLVKISSVWVTEQITNNKNYKLLEDDIGENIDDFLDVTFRYKGIIRGKNN